MLIQRLETEAELLEYQAQAARFIGVTFPLEYLRRSHVCAAYEGKNDGGRGPMLGGYMLVVKPPFRVIDSLPEEVRAKDPLLSKLPPESFFEITGLFLAPEFSARGSVAWFWTRLCWDVARYGNRYGVYAYCASKRHLRQVYAATDPRVVYSGKTRVLEGMAGEEVEVIEMTTRWKVALLPLRTPSWLLTKLFKERARWSRARALAR